MDKRATSKGASGLGFRVNGLGLRCQGVGFRVRVMGSGLGVKGLELRDWSLGRDHMDKRATSKGATTPNPRIKISSTLGSKL